MIKKLWEFGYMKCEGDMEVGYGISILLDDETMKEFQGPDPNEVRVEAMDYILKLYFSTSPLTNKTNTT